MANAAAPVKRGHPVLVTLLILFLVLIVLPIGLLYGFFYDPTVHTPTTGEADTTQLVSDAFFDSFKNAKQDKALKLKVSQESLNQVFAKVYQRLPAEAKNYVSGVYVDVNNTNYDFFVEAHVPLFNTRAVIKTELTDTVNETNPLEGFYQFKFTDVRVGRIGGVTGLINTFAKDGLTSVMNQLQSGLASAGLHMTVSWADQSITYTKANLLQDASKLLGQQELVTSALTQFFATNAVTLNKNAGTNMEFDTDLAKFHTKEGYVDENNDLNLKLDDYAANLRSLIDKGIVSFDDANLGDVYNYLIRGYDDVGESVRNKVASLDLSSIGIADVTAYKGADLQPASSLESKVKEQINLIDIANKQIAKISEADINEMLGASNFVGTGAVFARKATGANSEMVHLTFDNFNANILDGKMYFTIGMSVNGYEVRVILTTTMTSFENYRMTLKFDGAYFGETALSKEFTDMIKNKLGTAFSSGSCAFYNAAEDAIILDFRDAVNGSGHRAAIELVGTPEAKLEGASLGDENACLDLTIKPNLL